MNIRIRTLAFTYMTLLSCLAIGGAAYVWSRNWTQLSQIRESRVLVDVLAPTIKFVETLALERGAYNQVLVSKATKASDAHKLIDVRIVATDRLFATALEKAELLPVDLRARVVGRVAHAFQIVTEARAEADHFIGDDVPASTEAASKFVSRFVEAGSEIDKALGDAQRSLARIDPALGLMLEISRLSNDIRENAGLRSTLLTRYAATLKPFAIPERMRAVEAAGSVKITWRRMQRIAEQVETPRIAAAIEFVRT